MKTTTPFVLSAASLAICALALAACGKSATVSGEAGQKLTLTKPSSVTLVRGGMAKADVKIKRNNLAGDVTVRFTNLPAGVDVVDAENKIVGEEAAYTLRASDTAALVENSEATVTATGTDKMAVSQPISITVKEKK